MFYVFLSFFAIGYNVTQRNGQRIYGGPPPNWKGPAPDKGSEVFVGKVPRDMYEWELVPLFETVRTYYIYIRSKLVMGRVPEINPSIWVF